MILFKNSRTIKKPEIDLSAGSSIRPSPHVVDLKKILSEKKETAPVALEKKSQPVIREKRRLVLPDLSSVLAFPLKIIFYFLNWFFFGISGFTKRVVGGVCLFLKKTALGTRNFFSRFLSFSHYAFADYKKIINFGLVAFVFILPLQAFSYFNNLKIIESRALREAEAAYESLLAGGEKISSSNFSAAALSFDEAAGQFGLAGREIQEINFAVASLIKNFPVGDNKFSAGEAIVFAGEKFSWAGGRLMQSLADFSNKEDGRKLTQKIKILRNRLAVILPEVAAASDRLSEVNLGAVPEDKRAAFSQFQGKLPTLVGSLQKIISISDLMVEFLGDEVNRRYLFVFQNTSELRPTGGFMGSLALVDFDRGEIVNMEVPGGGPYDFNGSLKERIAAPEPLRLINARWELQDANWFPDFPASAKKIKWFYEKGGGPTVDGVIAVNSNFVAELLGIVGPIEMPEYGKTMTKENFIKEMQKSVEVEYDKKENQPKKIIGDMMPKLILKIKSGDPAQFGKILAAVGRALSEKDILVYSVFPEVEHQILGLGWGGQIKNPGENSDYLAIVHANLGGAKTDRVVDETVKLETNIAEDGLIKNRLAITRRHNGVKGEVFTGVRNVDYMRVYVPEGSALLSAQGFEVPPENLFESPGEDYWVDADLKNNEGRVMIDKASGTRVSSEFGKTVFGNWVQVDPGEEVTITFEYVLPFQLIFEDEDNSWTDEIREIIDGSSPEKVFYQLLVQKQSGAKSDLSAKINFPFGWQPAWLYGEGSELGSASVGIKTSIAADLIYSIGFIKK